MTFTYDPEKLDEESEDGFMNQVRFLIGDTDAGDPFLQDEEIKHLVKRWYPLERTLEYCAAVAADNIAAKLAREVSYSADGVSIGLQGLSQQFRELATQLRTQHKHLQTQGAVAEGYGYTMGEGLAPTARPFSFGTQMNDNPEAGTQDYAGRENHYYPEEYPNDIP